jgi:hypothetical protein
MAGALTISTLNNDTGVLATQNGMTGIAKAWVNFDGVPSTPTISASFNISSVSKTSTGVYTVNYTTAMPSANYCAVAGGAGNVTGEGSWNAVSNTPSAGSIIVRSFGLDGNFQNQTSYLVAVFSS